MHTSSFLLQRFHSLWPIAVTKFEVIGVQKFSYCLTNSTTENKHMNTHKMHDIIRNYGENVFAFLFTQSYKGWIHSIPNNKQPRSDANLTQIPNNVTLWGAHISLMAYDANMRHAYFAKETARESQKRRRTHFMWNSSLWLLQYCFRGWKNWKR